jgi:hypothetical protein
MWYGAGIANDGQIPKEEGDEAAIWRDRDRDRGDSPRIRGLRIETSGKRW